MKRQYNKTFYLIVSAVLSVAIHLVGFGVSDRVQLNVFQQAPKEEEAPERLNLSMVDVRERMANQRRRIVDENAVSREITEEVAHTKVKEVFKEQNLIPKPKPKLELTGLGRSMDAPKKKSPPPRPAAAPRPEIISVKAEDLSLKRRAMREPSELIPRVKRKNVDARHIPSLVTADEYQSAVGPTLGAGMRLSLPARGALELGALPPLRDRKRTAEEEGRRSAFRPVAGLPMLPRETTKGRRRQQVDELDSLLTVTMEAQREPGGGGTFRVNIAPNPKSDLLHPISKDVLFLIDSSTSISPRKLEHFKAAVLESLQYLNRQDRFNVVTFKDRPHKLFQRYTQVADRTLDQARTFLRSMVRGGMTDVYGGLAPFVGTTERATERPLIIFLMTDGKSTVKNKLDNETIIRQIVRINQAHVSIYTFSAGESANRFLLDFLAYSNRGASLHEEQLKDFKGLLVRFINEHSDLIVADLEYQLSGGTEGTIYPRNLPHLYRGETLSVYGRFPAGAEEIAIQIVGKDAHGRLEELIYRGNIRKALQSEVNLSLDWAAQKIFHLISKRTLSPSKEINDEIRRLARRYKLYVPYM